jgi:hypothetical protein
MFFVVTLFDVGVKAVKVARNGPPHPNSLQCLRFSISHTKCALT